MINITLPTKEIYQITFKFPDKHKPANKQIYTYAKLSRKIINPDNPEDYAWETIDETTAKCNKYTYFVIGKDGKRYKLIKPDIFTKYSGRKVAFTKLINRNFSREDRKSLWFIFLDKYGRG